MSLKNLRHEIRRLADMAGIEEEALTVLAEVLPGEPLEDPEAGHIVDCWIDGAHAALYFPLTSMSSAAAVELALALILHARKTEQRRITGLMDLRPFPPAGAWIVEPAPSGRAIHDHAADLYRQITEASQ